MAAAQNNRTTSIEFIVKPKEDLFLTGKLRTLARVTKGQPYPCKNHDYCVYVRIIITMLLVIC